MLRKVLYPIILFLIVFACVYIRFGDLVLHPNSKLLKGISDGLKNYYTPAYYIKHDKGIMFTGMNYPYNEHVVYTDNQPLISGLLNLFDNNVMSISNYTVGILNTLMFLSLWLCAWFLFLILHKHLRLPAFYALIFSALIALLSPQIARITGHYSLSYTCYIPILWYYLIKMQQSKNMLSGMLAVLTIIACFGLVHLYYLLIGALFILSYWFVFVLENRKIFSKIKKRSAFLLIAALAPLVIVRLFIMMSDPVLDRPSNPWGFLIFRAFVESVFLPIYGLIQGYIHKVYWYSTNREETHAYIGLIGTFVALFTIGRMCYKLFKRDFRFRFTHNKILNRSLKAAILTLLFSMGIPFIWGMEFLLELLPPLKQFRSLGRFAWIFYYVFTVFTAYTVYLWFRTLAIKNKPIFIVILMAGVVGLWTTEVFIHFSQINKRLMLTDNYFSDTSTDYVQILEDNGFTPNEFQAILSLPYFHIGSEKMAIHRNGIAFVNAAAVSYSTGLPMIQSHMSRASISQSNKQIQLLSNEQIKKEILNDLPNKKPLLLQVTEKVYFESEELLISGAKQFHQTKKQRLLELPVSFFENNKEPQTLPENHSKPTFWNSFELTQQRNTLSGTGAFYKSEGRVELISWPKPDSAEYELSFWVYIEPTVNGMPETEVQYMYNGESVHQDRINTKIITDIYKDWLKVTIDLKAEQPWQEVLVFLHGDQFWIDDLMVRKQNQDVYVSLDKTIKKNNFTISE